MLFLLFSRLSLFLRLSFGFPDPSPSLSSPFSAQSVPPRRLFISPSVSLLPPLPPLPLCLSRDRALASRDHSLRGCAAAAITARSARGLYLETRRRLVAKVTVHRECSIIERSVGMTERLRGGGKEGGFDNSYIYIYIEVAFDCFVETKDRSIISFASSSFIVISAMTLAQNVQFHRLFPPCLT